MRTRAHNEEGFLLIELVAATLIISIALLALIGAYSFGYFAIGSAGQELVRGTAREQPARALPVDPVRIDRPRQRDAHVGEVERRDVQHGRERPAPERH